MAELEKLGSKYRIALRQVPTESNTDPFSALTYPTLRRVARDPRFERLTCSHKGTYADDCLIDRVTQHKCYIVATCDKDLRRRVRKVPGIPLMYIVRRKYAIERLPDGGTAA